MDQNSILDTWKSCLTLDFYNTNTRLRRREFWAFFLLWIIVATVIGGGAFAIIGDAIGNLLNFALFLPWAMAMMRRLNDMGKSRYWVILSITGIGFFVLLGMACIDSQKGDNEWGPNPKGIQ